MKKGKTMFKIKIADLVIEIDNKYHYVESLCKDYIVEHETAIFSVCATKEEILKEKQFGNMPDAYCESVCIYRNIVKKLPVYDAFFLHAAVVEVDGLAYAFMAKSGTGKTTHVRLWCAHFGDRARIVNGDKPILRFHGDKLMAYGTPWCGKEGYNINTSTPVCGLCFIERSEKNAIRTLRSDEIISKIFHQMVMPEDENAVSKLLELVNHFVQSNKIWNLSCNISQEAVKTAYEAMSGKCYRQAIDNK